MPWTTPPPPRKFVLLKLEELRDWLLLSHRRKVLLVNWDVRTSYCSIVLPRE